MFGVLDRNSEEYTNLNFLAHIMAYHRATDKQASEQKIWFTVDDTYWDLGANIQWTTIIAHRIVNVKDSDKTYEDTYQMLYPYQHDEIIKADSFKLNQIADDLYENCLFIKWERERKNA